jgi:hypothetical protein
MQLVSYRNNILTVATSNDDVIILMATVVTIVMGNDDISNVCGYFGWLLCYH